VRFQFYLFANVLSAHIRALRFKGGEFDRSRTQVEEDGPPAMGILTARSLFARFGTYLAKDPMERTGRWPYPEHSSLSRIPAYVTEWPA